VDFSAPRVGYTAPKLIIRGITAIMPVKAVQEIDTLPADDFQSLEEKIYRTIEQLKAAREAKAAAEQDLSRARQQLAALRDESESLHREVLELRREREDVRARVEKMLNQIGSLTDQ
jgi:chromosome segregation ATPase